MLFIIVYNLVFFFIFNYRRIPYTVALKHRYGACAALLNPSSAEPLVWPSPLKFISELNQDAKALLEQALMEVNKEREKNILKGSGFSVSSPSDSDETGIDDNISEVIRLLFGLYVSVLATFYFPLVLGDPLVLGYFSLSFIYFLLLKICYYI